MFTSILLQFQQIIKFFFTLIGGFLDCYLLRGFIAVKLNFSDFTNGTPTAYIPPSTARTRAFLTTQQRIIFSSQNTQPDSIRRERNK